MDIKTQYDTVKEFEETVTFVCENAKERHILYSELGKPIGRLLTSFSTYFCFSYYFPSFTSNLIITINTYSRQILSAVEENKECA